MILPRAEDMLTRVGEVAALIPRQYYSGRCNPYYRNCNTAWYRWGRWVLAGVLLLIGLAACFILLFCASRRRRRARQYQTSTPMNAPNPGYYQQQYGAPAGNPPPQYGGFGGEAQGYYGQTNGVTQPPNAYHK